MFQSDMFIFLSSSIELCVNVSVLLLCDFVLYCIVFIVTDWQRKLKELLTYLHT